MAHTAAHQHILGKKNEFVFEEFLFCRAKDNIAFHLVLSDG
jgi:hypothetical protein